MDIFSSTMQKIADGTIRKKILVVEQLYTTLYPLLCICVCVCVFSVFWRRRTRSYDVATPVLLSLLNSLLPLINGFGPIPTYLFILKKKFYPLEHI